MQGSGSYRGEPWRSVTGILGQKGKEGHCVCRVPQDGLRLSYDALCSKGVRISA